jgi:hypothetical protein
MRMALLGTVIGADAFLVLSEKYMGVSGFVLLGVLGGRIGWDCVY